MTINEGFHSLPTRETLDQWSPVKIHVAHSMAQSDVYLLKLAGREMVMKDFSGRWGPFRWLWGAFILKKEYRMLKRLDSIDGVPDALGMIGRDALLMERLPAQKMPKEKERCLKPEFFEKLDRMVEAIHRHDIAHGDLRRRNILVDEQGRPYLIDFATAADRRTAFGALIFSRMARVDRLKVLRLKASYFPDSLMDDEQAELERTPLYLRVARFLKKNVYRHVKQKRWTQPRKQPKKNVANERNNV